MTLGSGAPAFDRGGNGIRGFLPTVEGVGFWEILQIKGLTGSNLLP